MPTHYSGTNAETLALDAYIKLTRSLEALNGRLARHKTHPALTPTQFGVLECLYHLGPLCQRDLSKKLLKSEGNITLVIDNLEKAGYVRRARSGEDRRLVYVLLTETGRNLFAGALPGHVAAIVAEMSRLTADEQILLGELCRKLGRSEDE